MEQELSDGRASRDTLAMYSKEGLKDDDSEKGIKRAPRTGAVTRAAHVLSCLVSPVRESGVGGQGAGHADGM